MKIGKFIFQLSLILALFFFFFEAKAENIPEGNYCPERIKAGQKVNGIDYLKPGNYLINFNNISGNGGQGECQLDVSNPDLSGQIEILRICSGMLSGLGVKLYNNSDVYVDLAGWVLYSGGGELFITSCDASVVENESVFIAPHGEITVYQNNDADFSLNKGEMIKLFSGPREMAGELQDEIEYSIEGKSNNCQETSDIQIFSSDETLNYNNENSPKDGAIFGSEKLSAQNQDNSNREIQYKIPESSFETKNGLQIALGEAKSNSDSKKNKQKIKRRKKDDRNNFPKDFQIFSAPSRQVIGLENDNSSREYSTTQGLLIENQNNLDKQKNSNDNNAKFSASQKMEKSYYDLFYRLWNNWFVWRIILPSLLLWVILYGVVLALKKKIDS